ATGLISDSLPPLEVALSGYRMALERFYDECKKQNLRLILLTQPVIYRDDLSEKEKALLWMGWGETLTENGQRIYYSASVLARSIQMFNDVARDFALKHPDVAFVDLAATLPSDTSVFYDDCHFNESGARKAAEIISEKVDL
ncbi:MAG: hypothetical protein RMJ53_10725, partial [Chitinophagales bacterium]|nr:hypothetical protein [Chitinophagales bacterium]